jgi:hypothetical protein
MKTPMEQKPFTSTILIRYGYGTADSWEWHIELEGQADGTYALSMVQFVTDPPDEEAADERELSPFTNGAQLSAFVSDVFQDLEDPLTDEEWTEMIDAIAAHDSILARQVKESVR